VNWFISGCTNTLRGARRSNAPQWDGTSLLKAYVSSSAFSDFVMMSIG
jgi:hypothetical protein